MPESPVITIRTIPKSERTVPQRIGVFLFQYVGGLLMDEKVSDVWTISLGRVLTVALLIQAMVGWAYGHDIANGQEHVIIAVLAYTFGTRVAARVAETVSATRKPRSVRTRSTDNPVETQPT